MTVHYRARAFVFKQEERMDADRIFSVFTREFGRVEIFAKSIRAIASKLKGGIEIFSFSELEFIQGKNRKTLVDAASVKKFKRMVASPEKFAIAKKVSFLLDRFVKEPQADEKIWNLTVDFFEKLNASLLPPAKFHRTYYYFFWNFMEALGYEPELSVCAACAKKLQPEALYFSYADGGVLCGECAAPRGGAAHIWADVVKTLRLLLKKDWQTLEKLRIGPTARAMLKNISDGYGDYLEHSYHKKSSL